MNEHTEQLCELRDRLERGASRGILGAAFSAFSICLAVFLSVTNDSILAALLLPIAILAGLELARNARRLVEIKTALGYLGLVEGVADMLQQFRLMTAEPEGRA